MVNRKLIRPNLAEIKERLATKAHVGIQEPLAREVSTRESRESRDSRDVRETPGNGSHPRRRPAPPEQTNAEAFYYLKQMNAQTPMVLILTDGEELRGHIEWYDRACLKVHREDGPNVLIFKHGIRYLYKQEEEDAPAAG